MATDKKRLHVYVTDEQKAEINHVANALGCSVSRLCGDVILSSLPNLRQLATALEIARTDPKKAGKLLREIGDSAQADLLDALKDVSRD